MGATAPKAFVDTVSALCREHDHRIVEVDSIRAYHFGSRYNVEVDVILPGTLSLVESHDLGLSLQDKIEEIDEVERCFVHMDYRKRNAPEHKVERSLQNLQLAEQRKKRRRRFSGKTWAKVAFLLPGGRAMNGGGGLASGGRDGGSGGMLGAIGSRGSGAGS